MLAVPDVRHANSPEAKSSDTPYTENFFAVFKFKVHMSRSNAAYIVQQHNGLLMGVSALGAAL